MTEQSLLDTYKRYLVLEKALSRNSVEAYLSDLAKLSAFVADGSRSLVEVGHDELVEFIKCLHETGIHPRSQARIVSGIRNFYKFLMLEGYIRQDPCELIEMPNLGRHVPEVLSIDEIDNIVNAVDDSKDEAARDRAMIEVLYGCGLRVSELVNMRLTDIFWEEEYVKITGKGNKQRLAPISRRAMDEIRDYLPFRSSIDVRRGEEGYLFISKRGKHLSRITIFHIVKVLAERIPTVSYTRSSVVMISRFEGEEITTVGTGSDMLDAFWQAMSNAIRGRIPQAQNLRVSSTRWRALERSEYSSICDVTNGERSWSVSAVQATELECLCSMARDVVDYHLLGIGYYKKK